MKHRLIRGSECCYGNSGHNFQEGYTHYHCTCGKWRAAFKHEQTAAIAHLEHVLQSKGAWSDNAHEIWADVRRRAKGDRP